MVRVAVDTGGTFTDVVLQAPSGWRRAKVPSTPDDPSRAVLEGLQSVLQAELADLLIHGTTVGTNALLERKGARTAFVTTAGFQDVLEIGRQSRSELYSLQPGRPEPVVGRSARFGVGERTLADGSILTELRVEELESLAGNLLSEGFESVAVGFLHAWINPTHERLAAKVFRAAGLPTTASHELTQEYREYERFSTAAVNSYLVPKVSSYLLQLERSSPVKSLYVMQSSGGVASAKRAAAEPVNAILSGPAGGVVGALQAGERSGFRQIMTLDMGGTSTDVALCPGEVVRRGVFDFEGMPLRTGAVDLHTVGAGGGSIARRDEGGALCVGPESAGAWPGPSCYGRGGRLPTVTDANVLLGILDPERPLAGNLSLDPKAARDSMEPLASDLGLSIEATCWGIREVVNASMVRALRVISVQRGHDPRDFALVAFGGAGGLHAADLAQDLGVRHVLVPSDAGLLSALGMLAADVRVERSQTVLREFTAESLGEVQERFDGLQTELLSAADSDGLPTEGFTFHRSIDLRYRGQSWELEIPATVSLERSRELFHEQHEQLYGYCDRTRPIELVALRVVGRQGERDLPAPADPGREVAADPEAKIREGFSGGDGSGGPVEIAHYERSHLGRGFRTSGPAVIHEETASAWVPPGWLCEVDRAGALLLTRERQA